MLTAKAAVKTCRGLLISAGLVGAIACGSGPTELEAPISPASAPSTAATAPTADPDVAEEPDVTDDPEAAETTNPVAATPNQAPPLPLPAECSNPTNQGMMTRCAQAEYAQVDAALNQRYQAVKGSLSAPKQADLVAAGRAWIAFRDADCEFVQSQFEGGSIQPMVYWGCLTQRTQDRIDELAGVSPSQSYAVADQQLNQVYQALKAVLSSAEQEQLTTAQLAWLDYRDLHCAVTASTDQCLALVTEFRTGQLQNQVEARSR
ncbi:MAG: DUF1311 domain-containing protein [Leptolyngbya sp. RL_3_1]|nr:DUF1311 domain-containing protein [Leptolyngbya sp. RL_3_1]